MVRMVPDRTGRFSQRPHYKPEELDRECEQIISRFLRDQYGKIEYPIDTDDLTKLIERDAEDLDPYANLSALGPDVEGVTEFVPGRKPKVRIAADLSNDNRRENRLRTTLTHEYGHVHFHAYLWHMKAEFDGDMFNSRSAGEPSHCKRETMLNAAQTDWMEWQAGYVCGALLMPVSRVRDIVGSYQAAHGIFGPVNPDGEHGQALIDQLMDSFQVSQDAARIRLLKLDYLGTERGPSLFG